MPLGVLPPAFGNMVALTPPVRLLSDGEKYRIAQARHDRACVAMANLLERQFRGVDIFAHDVAALFKNKWGEVSKLAHTIHDARLEMDSLAPPSAGMWSQSDLWDVL